jgi:AraC family L-rhamnose operon regulatory protein RhaS
MKVVREPHILSGFLYEDPLPEWPALTHCGEAVCEAGLRLRAHSHRGFELLLLSRGECTWQIDGRAVRQKMGELFVAFPRQPHALYPPARSELSVLWVGIDLAALAGEPRRLAGRLLSSRRHVFPRCHEVEPLLRGIVSQITSARARRRETVEAFLHTICQLLHQQLETPAGARAIAPYSYVVQKAVGYLQADVSRRIPLDEVTEASGCGLSELCRRFKAEVGCSPAEYHLRLRLTAAREALGSHSSSVTEPAYQFGFSSSQHFSAAFRRFFEIAPQEWRRCQSAPAQGAQPPSDRRRQG